MEKVLSFPPCTPSILFQNFLCSLFHFALHAKMKKRDIRFENEEVQKGNARICLLSGMLSVCTVTLVDLKHILCKNSEAREPDRATADCMPAGATRLFALELRSKAKSGTSVLKMKKCRREMQESVCIRRKLSVCTVTLVDLMHIICKVAREYKRGIFQKKWCRKYSIEFYLQEKQ